MARNDSSAQDSFPQLRFDSRACCLDLADSTARLLERFRIGLFHLLQSAAGTEQRLWPWQALAGPLRRDTVWWLGAAVALGFTVVKLWRTRRWFLREESFWTLMLALAPMGFLFLHPHPWAYMLVLPCPLPRYVDGGLVAPSSPASNIDFPRWRGRPRASASIFSLQRTRPGVHTSARWRLHALDKSPPCANFETLRSRRIESSTLPASRTFLKPCTAEWYLDTLFKEPAREGDVDAGDEASRPRRMSMGAQHIANDTTPEKLPRPASREGTSCMSWLAGWFSTRAIPVSKQWNPGPHFLTLSSTRSGKPSEDEADQFTITQENTKTLGESLTK